MFAINFCASLHSNFYPEGVQPCDENELRLYGAAACAANSDSWLFREVFEEVYSGLGVPFYAALGNHDYYNNANVSAQVAYTQRSPSRQWRMPSRYYSWVEKLGEGKIATFITLDTVILAGATIQGYYGRMHPLTPGALQVRPRSAKPTPAMTTRPVIGQLISSFLPPKTEATGARGFLRSAISFRTGLMGSQMLGS